MANEKEIIDTVSRIGEPILEAQGLELVDIEVKREARGWVLRLFIEKKDGRVSLDDCASVSRELGTALDVENPIPFPYHLEVSSPGLTRPLKKERDFTVFSGRSVRILTKYPIENMNDFKGTLLGMEGDVVRVQGTDKIWAIPYSGIARAHLDF